MGRTWRIGEVADRTGLTTRTLRHYDELGLLVPSARSWGDYRLYDEADLLRLLQIQNLKALGLSLQEIADALDDPDLEATATLRSHLEALELRIADEQKLAQRLRGLVATAERRWDDVLDAIALGSRLAHPDPGVRLRAALAPTSAPASELLDTMTSESDPAVRDALVLAATQRPDAAEVALAGAVDSDPARRRAAVRVLSKLREPASVPVLIDLLDDPDPQVVDAAVDALARLGDPAAAPGLAGLLGSGRAGQMSVVEALAALGEAAVQPVSSRLADPDPAVRVQAAETLGRAGAPAAVDALAGALADDVREVRLAAALALGEVGDAGRPALEGLLADPDLGGVARRLLDLHVG